MWAWYKIRDRSNSKKNSKAKLKGKKKIKKKERGKRSDSVPMLFAITSLMDDDCQQFMISIKDMGHNLMYTCPTALFTISLIYFIMF